VAAQITGMLVNRWLPTAVQGSSHRWLSMAPHAHSVKLKNEDFSRDPEVVAEMNAGHPRATCLHGRTARRSNGPLRAGSS